MKKMITYIRILLPPLLLVACNALSAQQVCENTRQEVTLRDDLKVLLFKEVSDNRVYFVPTTLQLSTAKGKPEFLYHEYTDPGSASPDGAILHMLLRWGLSKQQRSELGLYIRKLYGEDALPAGALYLTPDASGITISSTTRAGTILNASLQSKGHPPTTSGGKIAMSFHIGKNDVKTMSEAFKKPAKLAGTSFSIIYSYDTCSCDEGITQNNTIILKGAIKKWF